MLTNILLLFAALVVLALLDVPPWLYGAILIVGVIRAWSLMPAHRLAQRAQQVAERTRAQAIRGRKLNGSAA
jgi:cobalamin biosynthesis protein CobD/CbiB